MSFITLIVCSACAADDGSRELVGTPAVERQAAQEEAYLDAAQDAESETPAHSAGNTGSFFAIDEIGLGRDGFVALTNFTDVAVTLDGLYLCQGSDCFALPDVAVAAGETVRVAAGDGEDLENVVATGANFGELHPPDGEIAIFTSSDTEDPEALLLYLQWGSTPHELTDLAVDRGLWFETSYAPSGENATRLWRVEETGLWLWE